MEQRTYCNISGHKPYLLKLNEACLRIQYDSMAKTEQSISVWGQSDECENCTPWHYMVLNEYESRALVMNTSFPTTIGCSSGANPNHTIFKKSFQYEEYGQYELLVGNDTPDIGLLEQPVNSNLPILYAFVIYLMLAVLWMVARYIYRTPCFQSLLLTFAPQNNFRQDLGHPSPGSDAAPLVHADFETNTERRRRVHSLDTFRGLSIAVMIFVNYGGGKYWFFRHSVWNGLTVADLVFPWFMWLMGVSLVISLRSRLRCSMSRRKIFFQVLRRLVALFCLGVILNSGYGKNNIEQIRIFGVLQRIGLSYFIVASLETLLLQAEDNYRYVKWAPVRDVASSWIQWCIMLALLAAHTCITFLVDVPGCGRGYLGPGGLHNFGHFQNCTGGVAGYLDRLILGQEHMYKHPTCKTVYSTIEPYDPEGLLGTLTATFAVFLGVQAGKILITYTEWCARVKRWVLWSMTLGLIAGILCNFTKNDGLIPINKNLWSVSFVLALSSLAFLLLATLYVIIDVKKYWSGAPLIYAGMNSIVLYIGHELTRGFFPWSWKPVQETHFSYLLMHLWGMSLWIVISYVLYTKQIFISL